MSTQNLVSAELTQELKDSINTKLAGLKTDLNFVISLLPGDKRDYLSVGNVMLPFLDKAYEAAQAHPEILPAVFDKTEFEKDYKLTKDLAAIATQLAELNSSIQGTVHAVNSDTMVEALEVYATVQQNKDKVPGLDVTASELKAFFSRKTRKPKPETPVV
ncbi:MAG: hypothetical protein V1720_02500 [bacterium]